MIHPKALMSSAGVRPNGGRSERAGDAVHDKGVGGSTIESHEELRELVALVDEDRDEG